MASSLLTPTAVTREALAVLHQKLTFVGSINRQYDDSFAQSGAKIGDSLKIRLPNQYTVRTGQTLDVQDTGESSTTLQVSTRKGVDLNFSATELTLDLDDFSERILEPAMAVLAANIEADALSMYKDVYQEISDVGGAMTFRDLLAANEKLDRSLTPRGDGRSVCLNPTDNLEIVDGLKGLFQDSTQVAKQYREGYIGRTAGFSFMQNTLLPLHTTGSDDGTGDYLADGPDQTGATLTVKTGAGTFKQGDVVQIAGVSAVHPETKMSTGKLQQFVITSDVLANATSLPISPSIVVSGAKQTVSGSPADNAAVYKRESDESTAVAANADYTISMAYHRDAFTFASADLFMPSGVDFAAREVMDGISMRIVRAYDIKDDQFPCRIDVHYGYKAIRPQLACRLGFN